MIDTLLDARERSGRPIRIGIVGAGVMGRMVALQLLTPPPGMRLVCIANRTIDHAKRAFEEGGVADAVSVTSAGDLRVKMCIQPTLSYLETIHHELGHDYYFMQYWKMPVLYQQGANDGFHEAIGDALTLSITPTT